MRHSGGGANRLTTALDIDGAVIGSTVADRLLFSTTLSASIGQTDILAAATGFTTALQACATLGGVPGVGAGDPYIVNCLVETPGAGDIRTEIRQDDATLATNAVDLHVIAIGT